MPATSIISQRRPLDSRNQISEKVKAVARRQSFAQSLCADGVIEGLSRMSFKMTNGTTTAATTSRTLNKIART